MTRSPGAMWDRLASWACSFTVVAAAAVLLSCGGGGGACSSEAQKSWLLAWTNDDYLWYQEVPNVNPAAYPAPTDYFAVLKTPAITASGKPKDQFHFWYQTSVWQSMSQSGVDIGYGIEWVAFASFPPRKFVVAYVETGSPAAGLVGRGAQILSVDGVDFVNANDQASVDVLNAGLFPSNAGEKHTLVVEDALGSQSTLHLTAANVTSNPVPTVTTFNVSGTTVGYILFNDHLATAEKALFDAVGWLKTQGVADVVLDLRYNGGGYLDVASEAAYMIAPPTSTTGQAFETSQFNDKHPSINPLTGQAITPLPFLDSAVGLSVASGTALPNLGLQRVFILTGPGTCSASEAVMNGLRGVNVQVIQIGTTTCGKPYGFYPADGGCGTTYFSIEFQGVNAKGFGDYADGFTPSTVDSGGNQIQGCVVSDDFAHQLGDPNEALLSAALVWQSTSRCPVGATLLRTLSPQSSEVGVLKPAWRQNRILTR